MKKKLMYMLMLIIALILVTVGCKKEKQEDQEDKKPVVETPVEEADEEEKETILKDFSKMLISDVEYKELKAYIKDNIEKLSEPEADRMFLDFEDKTINNINLLNERLAKIDYNDISLALNEKYNIDESKIEQVENEAAKKLLIDINESYGKIVPLEGISITLDYSKLRELEVNLTQELKEYLGIRAIESDQPFAADGGLIITYPQLAQRLLNIENYLNRYIEGARRDTLINYYENYFTAYLKGLPNTPIYNLEDKTFREDVLASYEKTITDEGYVTSTMVYLYLDDIKKNDNIFDEMISKKADGYIMEARRTLDEFK